VSADGSKPPITIAHRAGNNLAKLEAAFDLGIEFAEADVWWRRGKLEVRHDKSAGPIPFLWDRWSLRPDRNVLAFDKLLDATLGRGKLFLDLKGTSSQLAEAIVAEAARRNAQDIIAASGNWPHLDTLATLLPDARLFYSVGSLVRLESLRPRLAQRAIAGISIDGAFLTEEIVDELKGSGVKTIVSWHVDTAERAREVLAWGVRGITTSNLELLVALRRGEIGPAVS
jgi:glycerophosphoryl diester phosphodiesterase